MPSEKLTRILRSKSPFSEEQISQMTDAEGWGWVYSNRPPAKKKSGTEVCFTGFCASEKQSLMRLATDAGLIVVTGVTEKLSMLCIGPNPGPAKLDKAKKRGVPLVTLEQFNLFLETGELPLDRSCENLADMDCRQRRHG